jgi:putative transposase
MRCANHKPSPAIFSEIFSRAQCLRRAVGPSIKEECLDKMIFFGEKMFRHAVSNYVAHYHAERNHQGLQNKIIEPEPSVGTSTGEIICRERLGGLLKYYHRRAA